MKSLKIQLENKFSEYKSQGMIGEYKSEITRWIGNDMALVSYRGKRYTFEYKSEKIIFKSIRIDN